ncbi:hypothetical protein ABIA16_003531 [Sinorhizobium fredii]
MIDKTKILPTWRFVLDPEMAVEAKKFFDFVDFWPPYSWTDDQIKSWVHKTIIGRMPERWPMIHRIDRKLDGLVSKTLMLMTVRPRDLPNGYRHLFGTMFNGITGPGDVQAGCKFIWDHKRMPQPKVILEPGEEDYDDARMVSGSTLFAEPQHRLDQASEEVTAA